MFKKYTLLFSFLTLLLVSCSDNNGSEPDPLEFASVYVTNEGNFSDSNGSITSFSPEEGSAVQTAFEDKNGRPLAGIIQESTVADGRLYVVLNSEDKIEVLDAETLESIETITLSDTPADIEIINEQTAYVTYLFSGTVGIVDLDEMEATDQTVEVGMQPRDIVYFNERLFVANNGSGDDNTISVVDPEVNEVVNTIEVGAGPNQIIPDDAGRLWVVCSGKVAYDENGERDPDNDIPGSLHVLDGTEESSIEVIETGGHPSDMSLNLQNGVGFLLDEEVYPVDLNDIAVGETPVISRSLNTIDYFPEQQLIYGGVSNGYTQDGKVVLYDIQGTAVDSFSTGIAPNGFEFMVIE